MTNKTGLNCLNTLTGKVMQGLEQIIFSKPDNIKNRKIPRDLNDLYIPFVKGDLVVLSGRPYIGKTSFALNIVERFGVTGNKPVLYLCPGINKETITLKLLCLNSNINYSHTSHGCVSKEGYEKLGNSAQSLSGSLIYLDNSPILNIADVGRSISKLNKKLCLSRQELALVVIDYIQLLGETTDKSRNRFSNILKYLKDIALKHKTAVLAISETSRVQKGHYFPDTVEIVGEVVLSGCADHADTVYILSREAYYDRNISVDRWEYAEISVIRSSHLYEDEVPLLFKRECFRFTDRL